MKIRLTPALLLSLTLPACASPPRPAPVATPAAATADRFAQWEADIRGFEDADRRNPPPAGAVLFYGSSSIRFWESLAQDFPDLRVINRGFGGSQMDDALHFMDRVVLPYRPRVIVLYEGDNDLAAGRTPAAIVADYRAFVDTVRHRLPETRVVFVAIKPSLARWNLVDQIRETNALVQRYVERDPTHLAYADVFTPMLGADGRPRPELFREDGLHMTPAGYALWTGIVRPLVK